MSHHGPNPFSEANRETFKQMKKEMNETPFRGATGDFPEGKLTKEDEGAIQFAVGCKDGKVVLDFGTPVAWVGMKPNEAVELAQSLLERARQCTDEVLTLKIG